jgi:hypothetical protein
MGGTRETGLRTLSTQKPTHPAARVFCVWARQSEKTIAPADADVPAFSFPWTWAFCLEARANMGQLFLIRGEGGFVVPVPFLFQRYRFILFT